jgi:putative transposase
MYAIKRELKLNNTEVCLMRGLAGFKRFVYNYCIDMLVASWQFEGIKAGDAKRIDRL